jgi:hypothetical protein
MIRCACVFALMAGAAQAQFCDDLTALAAQADMAATLELPSTVPPQTATCSTSLGLSGVRNVSCYWSYGYRTPEAIDTFEAVTAALSACLGQNAVMATDQSVNHPDAYDLRLFRLDGAEFAVSLKDKGALQQTLVFLRVPQSAR